MPYAGTSRIQIGHSSPDWELPLVDGGTLRLSTLRGKPALLFFWGSW